MAGYLDDVKLNQVNIEYQKMENQIVQEGLRMQLSQADIINKLDQMKKELVQNTINKIIPLSATNVGPTEAEIKAAQKSDVKDILNSIISRSANTSEVKKQLKIIINDDLNKAINDKLKNLKKTTPKEKEEKKLSPFQRELNAKLLEQADSTLADFRKALTATIKSKNIKRGDYSDYGINQDRNTMTKDEISSALTKLGVKTSSTRIK